ncbi:STM4015 family protein [Actinomadura harenae]|uniref:Leucine-rich repeat domain-containing protein n=1 Tax=Actinomadura harenae TaxID=2483351 RepID=A0A3M2M9W7_9ACTN|nr:STM4015 family protein [Actinomadura harenae]RMI46356.1 leucine-rich repeat domain-containing protein [Actinomadura harenae]
MRIYEYRTEFAGLPVAEFSPSADPSKEALASPASYAWAVRTGYDEDAFGDVWARFLKTVDTSGITALVIGYWGIYEDKTDVPRLLSDAAAALPALRALFLGDIQAEEAEISWIQHSDTTPVFTAFPALERVEVRGASGLSFEPVRSEALRLLRFESGGLPSSVVRTVGQSALPNLEHLDLWLGDGDYGGDATVDDLAPFLSGEALPKLRHLGLEDSDIQDAVAAALAGAPVVARLESLSLAMGTLTDTGAEALLSGQPLGHLKKLDLRHHYLSDMMAERVRTALPGVEIDLDGQQELDEDGGLYVEVSE